MIQGFINKLNVGQKIVAITVGTNACLLIIIGIGLFWGGSENFSYNQIAKTHKITQLMAESVKTPLIFDDTAFLDKSLQSLSSVDSIDCARVYNDQGEAVNYFEAKKLVCDQLPDHMWQTQQHQVDAQGGYFYAVEIRTPERLVGRLVVRANHGELRQWQVKFSLVLFVTILFGSFAAWLMSQRLQRFITTPLKAIADATGKVAKGELETKVELSGNNEIAQLAKHFNAMVNSLNSSTVSKDHLDNVMSCLPDALFLLTPDGHISAVNQTVELWTGESENRLVNSHLKHWLQPLNPDKIDWSNLDGFSSAHAHLRHISHPQTTVSMSISALKNADDQAYGLLCLCHDMAERMVYEHHLQQAMEDAQAANRAKSEFLSRMSHELRTPLNAILGFAQLHELTLKDQPLSQLAMGNEQILKAGRHLLNLINDVLDLVQVEQNKMRFSLEPCNVDEAVSASLNMLGRQIKDAGIQLVYESVDLWVKADFVRLKQVLINLLNNAIKYNRPKGSITLSVEAIGEDKVRISVNDTGVGIEKEDFPLLFQPFSRLRYANENEIEGSGVGLSLIHFLIEQMNGKLGVDSQPGIGSTFWLELARTQKNQLDTLPKDENHLSQKLTTSEACGQIIAQILYIEDNPSNRELMQAFFERSATEFELLLATNGEQGIQIAKRAQPPLILIDINLPAMDGVEVLGYLKDSLPKKTQFVALSADAMPEQIQRALDAGFDSYLSKPVNLLEIRQLLDTLVV